MGYGPEDRQVGVALSRACCGQDLRTSTRGSSREEILAQANSRGVFVAGERCATVNATVIAAWCGDMAPSWACEAVRMRAVPWEKWKPCSFKLGRGEPSKMPTPSGLCGWAPIKPGKASAIWPSKGAFRR